MHKLPEEWIETSIDSITIKGEQRKPEESEEFTYVDIGSIDRERKTISEPQVLLGKDAPSRARKVVQNGDVIVSLTRPNLNAVALVDEKYDGQIASTGFEVLKPVLVNSLFIFALVRSKSFIDGISGKVQGALYPAAKSADVKAFNFPLPPLAEQEVIAAKLDSLLSQVEQIKGRIDAVPAILKKFRLSVLAAAVSGKLTEAWRGSEELVCWEEGVLSNWIEKPSYGTSSKSQNEGKIPVLRMGNLQDGKLDWTDLVYSSNNEEIEKYNLVAGDVLFNRTNSPELVGKTSIYRGERQAIYAGYLIKILCKDMLNSEFLNYHLNSPSAKQYCRMVKSDGVSQSNINAKKLGAYPMSLPPLEEQKEIVRQVEKLFAFADTIESRVTAAQSRVDNLTQSILAKAFRGELTAEWRTQNHDLITGENSAAALLERIKEEREKLAKEGKKKKTTRKKTVKKKTEIIGVLEALKNAGKKLTSQELFTAAGYPNDASTDLMEKFFLDVRNEKADGTITSKKEGDVETFSLVDQK